MPAQDELHPETWTERYVDLDAPRVPDESPSGPELCVASASYEGPGHGDPKSSLQDVCQR